MDLSSSRIHTQESPSVYSVPFSSPSPLFQYYWPTPIRGFFVLLVDYPRVIGPTSIFKDPMDGDYPRVAFNRAGEIVALTELDSLPFVEPWKNHNNLLENGATRRYTYVDS